MLSSLSLFGFFFRFGVGILHSIPKATQLVHGTPRLAASHRTYEIKKHRNVSDTSKRGWRLEVSRASLCSELSSPAAQYHD